MNPSISRRSTDTATDDCTSQEDIASNPEDSEGSCYFGLLSPRSGVIVNSVISIGLGGISWILLRRMHRDAQDNEAVRSLLKRIYFFNPLPFIGVNWPIRAVAPFVGLYGAYTNSWTSITLYQNLLTRSLLVDFYYFSHVILTDNFSWFRNYVRVVDDQAVISEYYSYGWLLGSVNLVFVLAKQAYCVCVAKNYKDSLASIE